MFEPTQITRKVLLIEGQFTDRKLSALKDRIVSAHVIFKSKVADKERIKFATLLTVYTVKIYDAQLKKAVYRSSYFLTEPFEDDPHQSERAIPRTTIYTNFFVTPQGDMFASQLPRDESDTTW